MTWMIFLVVFGAGLYHDAYQRGRRAGLAARPAETPCPPIPIVEAPRRAAREPPIPPTPDRVSVRIGRQVVEVDASSLSER